MSSEDSNEGESNNLNGPNHLEEILEAVLQYVAPGSNLPNVAPGDRALALVASALLRSAAQQAMAVKNLAVSPFPETAGPNVRSIVEVTAELYYLLNGSGADTRGRAAFCWAHIEVYQAELSLISGKKVSEWSSAEYAEANNETLVNLTATLAAIAHEYPFEFREASFAKRSWHNRQLSELVKEFFSAANGGTDNLGKLVYKGLSWESHHSLAVLRFVESNRSSPMYGKYVEDSVYDNAADLFSWLAAELLNICAGLHWERFGSTEAS